MPTMTDTRIPIRNGRRSVAHIIRLPTFIAAFPSAGAHQAESATPTPIVTRGAARLHTKTVEEMAQDRAAARANAAEADKAKDRPAAK